jgi:hypothetical protein
MMRAPFHLLEEGINREIGLAQRSQACYSATFLKLRRGNDKGKLQQLLIRLATASVKRRCSLSLQVPLNVVQTRP